jgi:PAS domain S-box-containing protein
MTRATSNNKQAEKALKRQSAQWNQQAALLDLTHDAMFVWALEPNNILFWNAGATELYGWNAEQAVGQTPQTLLKTVLPERLNVIAALHQKGRWDGELIHTRSDGSTLIVASRWALQWDDRGKPVSVVEIDRDITRERSAETALRDVQARLSLALRRGGIGTWTWDTRQDKVTCDDQFPVLFGMPPGEVEAGLEHFTSRVHPDDQMYVLAKLRDALESGNYRAEFRVPWPDGQIHVLAARGEATFEAGKPVKLSGVCWDVTDREEVDDRLRLALTTGEIGAWTWDTSLDVVSCDHYLPVLFGLPTGMIVSTLDYFTSRVHPDDQSCVLAELARGLETGTYEARFRVRWPDGSVHTLAAHGETSFEGGKPANMTGVCWDITERKAAEPALRALARPVSTQARELERNRKLLELVVEATPSAMIVIAAGGLIILVNSRTEKLFGYDRHELLGQSVDVLLPKRFRSNQGDPRNAFTGGPASGAAASSEDLFGVSKDGREVKIEVNADPIGADEQFVLATITRIDGPFDRTPGKTRPPGRNNL